MRLHSKDVSASMYIHILHIEISLSSWWSYKSVYVLSWKGPEFRLYSMLLRHTSSAIERRTVSHGYCTTMCKCVSPAEREEHSVKGQNKFRDEGWGKIPIRNSFLSTTWLSNHEYNAAVFSCTKSAHTEKDVSIGGRLAGKESVTEMGERWSDGLILSQCDKCIRKRTKGRSQSTDFIWMKKTLMTLYVWNVTQKKMRVSFP